MSIDQFDQQKTGNLNRSSFQKISLGPGPYSGNKRTPNNRGDFRSKNSHNLTSLTNKSQYIVAQGARWTPTCAICGRNHQKMCRDGSKDD